MDFLIKQRDVEITPELALKAKLYRIKSELLYKGAEGEQISTKYVLNEDIKLIYVFITCQHIGYSFSLSQKDYTEEMIDLIIEKVFPGFLVE